MRMRGILLTVLLIALATLSSAESPLKACSLLTAVEIHDIAGFTVDQAYEDSMMPGSAQCSWGAKEENAPSLLASFVLASAQQGADCKLRYEGEKKMNRLIEDASGFGTKSWWSLHKKDEKNSVLALNVCGPKGILRISLWGSIEKDRDKKIIEGLTRKAMARL